MKDLANYQEYIDNAIKWLWTPYHINFAIILFTVGFMVY